MAKSKSLVLPEPAVTITQTPTGRVVLRQADQLITISPQHIRDVALAIAACVHQVARSETL